MISFHAEQSCCSVAFHADKGNYTLENLTMLQGMVLVLLDAKRSMKVREIYMKLGVSKDDLYNELKPFISGPEPILCKEPQVRATNGSRKTSTKATSSAPTLPSRAPRRR